jgi:uncharacterized protein (DUF342 family)
MEHSPRIVQGANEAILKQEASALFGVPEQELIINYISALRDDVVQAVVFPAAYAAESENMDSIFQLHFKNDGTYLELLPARGNGKTLDPQRIEQFLQRKKLKEFKTDVFDQVMKLECGYEKVAGAQEELLLNEDLEITVSQDEMLAFAALLPAENGGLPMNRERALSQLTEKGVTHGIDDAVLESLIEGKQYFRRFGIARGAAAVDGESGYLQFHFERVHPGMQALFDEKVKVDYKNLDLYSRVKAGDKLVTNVQATEGETGYTVKGKQLKQKLGKDAKMPRGEKVTYNEDKSIMFAAVSGRVDYVKDRIVVSNVLTIDGDVDLSVGNVEFDGDVVVKGNVLSGFIVKATGRIEVKGNVQRAEIRAGGDVVVINGIQGLDSGLVETGGTLTTKFMERSKVRAKVAVIADQIIQSNVECGGEVMAKGEHGAIIGGNVKAASVVIAKTIGTEEQIKTSVEVGISPSLRNELALTERTIAQLSKQIDDLEKICNYLKTLTELPPERQDLLRKSIQSKLELAQEQEKLILKQQELSSITESATDGKIHVTKEIYPGVSLFISMVPYRVMGTPIQAATFRNSKGEITFGPCEAGM